MQKFFVTLGVSLAAGLATLTASAQAPVTPPATTPTATPAAPATTPAQPSVVAANKDSLIKIDGRFFVGIFSSDHDGAYPNRALDVPDAKLRFTFTPSKDITIVNRFSNNKGASNGFDYFYLDLNNWGGALPGHVLRAGKVKIDTGEETWTDNPMESILITNSAASVGGYDGGVNFRGPIPLLPATYSVAVYNSTGGVGSATNGLAAGVKVSSNPIDQLYFSASYYDSGDMIKSDGTVTSPALKVANLQSVPSGAKAWDRKLYEVDARWNYGKNGITPVIPSNGKKVPFQVGVAYGHWSDDFAGVSERDGNYWSAEALYNVTAKLYLAARYSEVKLEDGMTAKLVDSPVAVNAYQRRAFGAGYHLTPLTDLKVEFTNNVTDGGTSKPKLNQITVGLANKF